MNCPLHPDTAMTNISRAAAAMGKKGGKVKSPAKIKAAQENGKLGGRPKKQVISPEP